ncbi:hypothetical protein [Pseudomonas entomophila]|uniref:Uncharacterized protein n=2 Tax=Pseudomonas entomophila TaxID=312306 RepID=Q1ICT5_PSEE4|nr:hypothetical protein [Pseudomonas entomophila]WMW04666.1 hypothetical protein RAH46_20330 [Pseudomonas entomophila]CAK14528.1 hypothetical protein; putative membrane protein [Pseudomonas entomophila L48]
MFGQVLTYDVYHLALYLISALAWGMLGVRFLLLDLSATALLRCFAMFGLAMAINAGMLMLDIRRVLEHHQVELLLVVLGGLLPGALMLIWKARSTLSKRFLIWL